MNFMLVHWSLPNW